MEFFVYPWEASSLEILSIAPLEEDVKIYMYLYILVCVYVPHKWC